MNLPHSSVETKDPAVELLKRATRPQELFDSIRRHARTLEADLAEIYEEHPIPLDRPDPLELSPLEGYFRAKEHYQKELEARLPQTVAKLKCLLNGKVKDLSHPEVPEESILKVPIMLSIILTEEGDLCLSWEPEMLPSQKEPDLALEPDHPEVLPWHTLIHIPSHLLPDAACEGGVNSKTTRSLCAELYSTLHLGVLLCAAEIDVEIGTWLKFDRTGAPRLWPIQDRLLDFVVPDREHKVAEAAKVHLELEHRLAKLGIPDENTLQSLIQESVYEGLLPEKVFSNYSGRAVTASEVVGVLKQRSRFEASVQKLWQEGTLAYRAWALIRAQVPRDQLDPEESRFHWNTYQIN